MQKGKYFIGTPSRLTHDTTFGLRTGVMVSRKNASDKFVSDKIYISGTPDVFEIEKQFRMSIKWHNPNSGARMDTHEATL